MDILLLMFYYLIRDKYLSLNKIQYRECFILFSKQKKNNNSRSSVVYCAVCTVIESQIQRILQTKCDLSNVIKSNV